MTDPITYLMQPDHKMALAAVAAGLTHFAHLAWGKWPVIADAWIWLDANGGIARLWTGFWKGTKTSSPQTPQPTIPTPKA